MKKQYIFLVLALLMVFTQACKKKKDNPVPAIENRDLLKAWKISKALENALDVTSEFSQYKITFADDGTNKTFILVNRQGTTQTGSWTIAGDKTSITLSVSGGATITLFGVSFNAGELKYQSDETGKAGNVTIGFTLVPA